jgi:hypothetical protein
VGLRGDENYREGTNEAFRGNGYKKKAEKHTTCRTRGFHAHFDYHFSQSRIPSEGLEGLNCLCNLLYVKE